MILKKLIETIKCDATRIVLSELVEKPKSEILLKHPYNEGVEKEDGDILIQHKGDALEIAFYEEGKGKVITHIID